MTTGLSRLASIALAIAFLFGGQAAAQTSQYWTEAFGARAQLLGGAVIASDDALSAVFYNPGLLGTGAGSQLIITGNIFEAEFLAVKEAVPPERTLSGSRFRLLPSLFAGEFYGDWLGESRLAYSFFTRADSRLRSDTNFGDDFAGLIDDLEFLSDQVRLDTSMSEYWGGFTWGRSVGERHGVGISMFVGARNQRTRLQRVDQAIFSDGTLGVAVDASDFDFNNYRLFWKLGYSTEVASWRLGATLTTPAINLFGSGKLKFDDSQVLTSDRLPSRITTTFQEDLSTEWKTPLSIGLGASRDWGRYALHLSFEWFDSVAPFTVIEGEEFASQTTGEVFDPSITHALDSVLNFAIGLERLYDSGVRSYLSFRSDFGAGTDEFDTNLAAANFDLWHIGGGATFAVGSSDMTLGLSYAFGSTRFDRVADIDEPLEFHLDRIIVVLGFELPTGPSAKQDG